MTGERGGCLRARDGPNPQSPGVVGDDTSMGLGCTGQEMAPLTG